MAHRQNPDDETSAEIQRKDETSHIPRNHVYKQKRVECVFRRHVPLPSKFLTHSSEKEGRGFLIFTRLFSLLVAVLSCSDFERLGFRH